MEGGINYLPIFYVMAIAWIVPIVMANVRFIKIPPVIIEILLGFIIGANVLNILPETEYMTFLKKSGFFFLLFMSGLEINVQQILSSLPGKGFKVSDIMRNPLLAALVIYFLSLGLSFIVVLILQQFSEIPDVLFFSLVIPTVALSIVVPVLKEQGDIAKPLGQLLMLGGAISTIMSIVLISFYSGIIREGVSFELLLFSIIFLTFFVSLYLGRILVRIRLFQRLVYQLQHAASQIKVRGAVALIFGFVVVSSLINVQAELGAFLSGIVLSVFLRKERSSLIIKLDGMSYGFFVPIFFIMVGATLDLSALDQFDNSYLFLAVLFIGVFAAQVLPALLLKPVFGWTKSISAGVLLTSRLGLTIATAQIGLELGVISPAVNAGIVIVSILSSLIAPLIYNYLHPKSGFAAEKTIIVGGGRISILLAERLKLHGKEAVIMEVDKNRYEELCKMGLPAFLGAGMDKENYETLNLQPQNYVVVLTGSEQRNVLISKLIHDEFNHTKIITDVVSDEYMLQIDELDTVDLDVRQILASAIENMIFRPDTYHHMFEDFGQYTMQDITLTNRDVEGKLVRDIPFHQEGSLMVIRRQDQDLIPHGDTRFKTGDIATVIGNDAALEDFRKKLE
ncbi:MAG: monovalent cation:proton antiporter family protein [Bacteroidia bacterium]